MPNKSKSYGKMFEEPIGSVRPLSSLSRDFHNGKISHLGHEHGLLNIERHSLAKTIKDHSKTVFNGKLKNI